MIKVNILTRCDFCKGEAYLPIGEAESYTGEKYMQYEPCDQCQGSGKQERWAFLKELADLLGRAISCAPGMGVGYRMKDPCGGWQLWNQLL